MECVEQSDAIVVGSGFGGVLAAYPLVRAGWRVLMLERGDWVRRGPENWAPDAVRELSSHYDHSTPYEIRGAGRGQNGTLHCVGGGSVYYGGVSLRMRERDFVPWPEERAAGAEWPFDYDELEPYYTAAERLIGVAGESGADPTEPRRSAPYPQPLPPLSRIGQRLADAAEQAGYHPFRLPLAINYSPISGRSSCIGCNTCDCYPCAISAKNDMASALLPELLAHGLRLLPNTAVLRVLVRGRRATGVECLNLSTGERRFCFARHVILAAGALATPHLLLASGLAPLNPAGHVIGATLMRHCNAVVFGFFPRRLDAAREFHKQIGINDLYYGDRRNGADRLGTIQQIHAPPIGLVRAFMPRWFSPFGVRLLDRMTGLIAIGNDEPSAANRVSITGEPNRLGMPRAIVQHQYTRRDLAARGVLVRAAKDVLREAGAVASLSMPVRTFSHAIGTVRFGREPENHPLDEANRFRGIDNLYVADGSVLPTSAAVNPSLTIAAVALRAGCLLSGMRPAEAAHVATRHRTTQFAELEHV